MGFARRPLATLLAAGLAGMTPSFAQAPAANGPGPSFPCRPGQGPIEATICASPSLSAADRLMAALTAADRVSAFGTGPSNMAVSQRRALKDMQSCGKPPRTGSVEECLHVDYDARNEALAIAALVRAPDLALPVLRRLDPPFAPIAEAIALWQSEPRDADWSAPARGAERSRIAALLEPVMKDLQTKDEDSYSRSILADSSGGGFAVTRIDDLFKSERHFAAFLNVLGPVLPDRPSAGVIPCAAIVRHPKLLNATTPVFGSTMDNFVLDSDCEATLPPTPALTALDAKLNKHWPACQGTIRFAAYRAYRVSLDAARLGITEHDPKAAMPRRRGVTPTDVAAARTELAAHYARYLVKTPTQARKMAVDAIRAIMNAGQECE